MASACVEIADAVVAALNTPGVFSVPFTAVRAYDPQYPREEMKTLHVTVVPASKTTERLDRHQWQYDVTVDVAVQQAYEEADNDTLDPLMALVEEIELYFGGGRRVTDAILVRMANVPVYAPEHMDALRTFTSVLSLTFRVAR